MVSSTSRAEAGVRARRSSPTSRRRCQRSRTARQRMHSSSARASAIRTGRSSRPSDFLRAFERSFRGRSWAAQNFPSLVGADACKRRPRRCDLSQGVRTDDATGTIVFHLRRPDPRLPGSLTGWPPIPPGTPNRDLGTRPVPSTGPYTIKSYVPKRILTLVRNPYFRVWSRVASPDGFPDTIVIRLSADAKASLAQRAGLRAVQRGQADLAYITPDTRPEELEARYPSRRAPASRTGDGLPFPQHAGFRPSTTFASAAQSTSPSTAPPLRGRKEGRSSLRRRASYALRARSVSGDTAPTPRIRIGQASGRGRT